MQYCTSSISLLLLLCCMNSSAQCLENISGEYIFGSCSDSSWCIPVRVAATNDTEITMTEQFVNGTEVWSATVHCADDSLSIHPCFIGPCGNVYKVDGYGTFDDAFIYLHLHWMPWDNVYGGEEHWTSKTYHRSSEETSTENMEPSQDDMDVYPNPFTQFITLVLPEQEGKQSHIEILDATGKRMKSMQVTSISGGQQLDMSALAQGSYYIRCISAEGKIYCRRIIKTEP